MVVPVLMTNCQVSEKWKIGPVIPQPMMTRSAIRNASQEPVTLVTLMAIRSNQCLNDRFLLRMPRARSTEEMLEEFVSIKTNYTQAQEKARPNRPGYSWLS